MSFDPQTGLPVQQRQSGGCFKSCMTMGCIGVVLIVVCCGGFTWMASSSFQFQNDPQIATLVGQEIAGGDLFDDFTATASIKVDLPIIGPVGKMAMYEGADKAMLMIGEVNANVAGAGGKEALEQKLREELQNNSSHKDLQVVSQKTRELQINGKPHRSRSSMPRAPRATRRGPRFGWSRARSKAKPARRLSCWSCPTPSTPKRSSSASSKRSSNYALRFASGLNSSAAASRP